MEYPGVGSAGASPPKIPTFYQDRAAKKRQQKADSDNPTTSNPNAKMQKDLDAIWDEMVKAGERGDVVILDDGSQEGPGSSSQSFK